MHGHVGSSPSKKFNEHYIKHLGTFGSPKIAQHGHFGKTGTPGNVPGSVEGPRERGMEHVWEWVWVHFSTYTKNL